MFDKVIIIKNKLDSIYPKANTDLFKRAKETIVNQNKAKYTFGDIDCQKLNEMRIEGQDSFVLWISYINKGDIDKNRIKTDIQSILLGVGQIKSEPTQYDHKYCLDFKMSMEILDSLVIINLLDNLELDLQEDFTNKSYFLISELRTLCTTINNYLIDVNDLKSEFLISSNKVSGDANLLPYAQKDIFCIRQYANEMLLGHRSEFQRDRERIVNCKAFRRMVDKAQVFSATKGDYYRTRMTHTLEVNQIAKAIAIALNLNIDLTEAIALGHDLGHTPFGHAGERTLKDILKGKIFDDLFCLYYKKRELELEWNMGSFKHNYQGLRVLCCKEEKYVNYPGLNISMQVLEGILKHTKFDKEEVSAFIDNRDLEKYLHLNYKFSTSLEGQVVAIADEIAQRSHDIDDAATSGLLTDEELLDLLVTDKFSILHDTLSREKESIKKCNRYCVDVSELTISRFISIIVDFFIKDVIKNSLAKIQKLENENSKFNNNVITEEVVSFSSDGMQICKFLEKVINKKSISSPEVIRFDYNSRIVIKKLFETYYNNPRLLHKGTLYRIYNDMLQSKIKGVREQAICFVDVNPEVAKEEIERLTKHKIKFEDANNICSDDEILFTKRKILVRNIVDYIAGMTDSYAMNEFNKIKG